jgi:hypothetical protein
MSEVLRQFRDFFVSLRLTVVLLALGIILIFWATLAQTDLGVWGVQQKFFHSFFVLELIPGTRIPAPVFPGGYFIGGLLFLNLIAAHVYRFRYSWRKTGIWLTHAGLIMLLVGELLSGLWQQDYQISFREGESRNYAESLRDNELVITDVTDPQTDQVVAIPEELIARGEAVQHPRLPFRVVPRLYYPNADLQQPGAGAPPSLATQGPPFVRQLVPVQLPLTYKETERNLPAAYVELVGAEGSLGTWVVSTELPMPQHFTYGGRSWKIALRYRRDYLPFSLTLLKFSHDIYPGTDIPKNFSSRVRLAGPDAADRREALIYMNNPLRAAGRTFYQASYDPNDPKATVLQVVRNPSWTMPYVSCAMMALGLVFQFGLHLLGFARRRASASLRGAHP